jgi:hypothetical protein
MQATRHRIAQNGFPSLVFQPQDINRLASPTSCLNDICLNGCAALLYSSFGGVHAERCAIMSTHDLVRIHHGALDIDIWRNIHRTLYWQKDIWIIPIHRPERGSAEGHWVLCVAFFRTRQFLLFDSLAGQDGWQHDLKVCQRVLASQQPIINLHS